METKIPDLKEKFKKLGRFSEFVNYRLSLFYLKHYLHPMLKYLKVTF